MTKSDFLPIFFIGFPRSGTTAIFEAFTAHPELAWITNYSRVFPRLVCTNILKRALVNDLWQLRGKKNQFNDQHPWERYLPRPDESYEFWSAHTKSNFPTDYLSGEQASEEVKTRLGRALEKTARYQGKSVIAAKLTGPGRITYLNSVFSNAKFIHVIRDGFDAIRSLLNVPFWREGNGFTEPWWKNGLSQDDLDLWSSRNKDPSALAAIQWRRVVRSIQAESAELQAGQYLEVTYEEFIRSPARTISQAWSFSGLPSREPNLSLDDIRTTKYRKTWVDADRQSLLECMDPEYSRLFTNLKPSKDDAPAQP